MVNNPTMANVFELNMNVIPFGSRWAHFVESPQDAGNRREVIVANWCFGYLERVLVQTSLLIN